MKGRGVWNSLRLCLMAFVFSEPGTKILFSLLLPSLIFQDQEHSHIEPTEAVEGP